MKQKTLLTQIVGGLLILFGGYHILNIIEGVNKYEYHYNAYKGSDPMLSLNAGLISITLAIVIGIGAWLIIDYKQDNLNP